MGDKEEERNWNADGDGTTAALGWMNPAAYASSSSSSSTS
jgi:hypothetical protein